MELIRISTKEQLMEYQQDWSTILDENQNTNPFIEFTWIYEWWKHLGEEYSVEIIHVRKDDKSVAFFPFVYEKGWLNYTYYFMAFGLANYMDFVAIKKNLDETIEYVIDEIIRTRKNVVFYLHGLLESSDTPKSLEVYLQKRRFSFSATRVITPYIDLKKIKMDKYMAERQRLHRLDRREKKLREIGDFLVAPTNMGEMETLFKLHEKQWEKKHDTSGFTNEKEKNFFRSLACIQDGPMKTEIDSLYINDTMIAFNYGFNCRGRFLGYVLGFDNDFQGFGPGRILEKEKILQCKDGGYSKFDLSIGYEPYKFDWNTDVDYTRKMIFSSSTVSANTLRYILSMKEALIERVKKNHKVVLFKRNKIGKLLYTLRNLFNKNGMTCIWMGFTEILKRVKKNIYERNQFNVYKIERKNIADSLIPDLFVELKLEDALNDPIIAKQHMKEVCRKMYGGYTGYYYKGSLAFESIIWTNEKVLRIDSISHIENFRKSSIHISNWNEKNLADVCSYVKQKSNAKVVYVTSKNSNGNPKSMLENLGFTICKKIYKRTYMGFRKFQVTE